MFSRDGRGPQAGFLYYTLSYTLKLALQRHLNTLYRFLGGKMRSRVVNKSQTTWLFLFGTEGIKWNIGGKGVGRGKVYMCLDQ